MAVEFGGTLADWSKRTGSAQTAILDAATAFERDARNLEVQAGEQRREDRAKEEREKEKEKEGPR